MCLGASNRPRNFPPEELQGGRESLPDLQSQRVHFRACWLLWRIHLLQKNCNDDNACCCCLHDSNLPWVREEETKAILSCDRYRLPDVTNDNDDGFRTFLV